MDVLGADSFELLVVVIACTFPALLSLAAVGDVLRYLIPNTLCLGLALLAIPAMALSGADVTTILWHGVVGMLVLVVVSLLFFRGMIGGGDVKLLAAAAIWTGWPLIVPLLIYTACAGGLIAVALLLARRCTRNREFQQAWLGKLLNPSSGLPYGVAIAIAGWIVWFRLPIFSTAFPT